MCDITLSSAFPHAPRHNQSVCLVQFFGSMLDRPLYQPQPDPNKPDFNKQTPFSPADAIRLNIRHIIPPYKHKELNTRLVRKTR